jgi:putative aldouronate transport system permease protein
MKSNVINPKVKKKNMPSVGQRLGRQGKLFLRDWQLHLLILVPVIYMLIFHYYPMYGVQIAFRNYRPKTGITGSEWVGWKWFEKFLTNYNFRKILWNTIVLSLQEIVIGFPLPIILALMLNTIRNEKFKTFVQRVTYIPHFISLVILVAMFNHIFNPMNGLYGAIYRLFNEAGRPDDFRGLESTFRAIYVWTGVWQNLGWNTIIFTAALSAVSQDQHEAAEIDGASRLQRIFHVDIPAILPTICIMLILRCGRVMTIGFEKVYLLQSTLNLNVSEVISTYVYKVGMGKPSDHSYGAAIGLFNSVVNCTFLVLVNWITKKLSDKEVGLF